MATLNYYSFFNLFERLINYPVPNRANLNYWYYKWYKNGLKTRPQIIPLLLDPLALALALGRWWKVAKVSI
ncbi:hypothetical protein AGABI1DRAFT_134108 [Agaricus bisporus var. burnettii JB137-S8]|uniref:Uncharacterized protein n=1 Tax=Agaricus bisporus var. burnettii (strain JB137-S8 / ATCC MYA-4627 / FGSC 10392) TaxID=597362 RepID=K5VHG9_AGABU|nr:uncharacterized protein AGABI1DRAFT_134108 [Agaricus bisporus var. burnettii JB137-S8]EKM73779.1 hypothetical protein AGABI1DRAFT_134108 [Agaricus bisporus var. burnettii JB137-S8]